MPPRTTQCSEEVTSLERFDLAYTGECALWVPGIGAIAQHDCYVDMQWEKGVVYFMRDLCKGQIESQLNAPNPDMRAVRELVARMERLNSKIRAHEMTLPPLPLPDMPMVASWADDDEWDAPHLAGFTEPRKRRRALPTATRANCSAPPLSTHNRFEVLTPPWAPQYEPPEPAPSALPESRPTGPR